MKIKITFAITYNYGFDNVCVMHFKTWDKAVQYATKNNKSIIEVIGKRNNNVVSNLVNTDTWKNAKMIKSDIENLWFDSFHPTMINR